MYSHNNRMQMMERNNHHHPHMPHHHLHRPIDIHDPEEKKPFNRMDIDNGGAGGDTGEVHYKESSISSKKKNRSCCYLSRTSLVIIGLLLFLLIILIGVIVALVWSRKPCFHSCPLHRKIEPEVGALNSSSRTGVLVPLTTPAPSTISHLPWGNIRLPRDVIPYSYDLQLRIDLEDFLFTGKVMIDIVAKMNTKYIVLHTNNLDISDGELLKVKDLNSNLEIDMARSFYYRENQFFVIELSYGVFKGRHYRIEILHFFGELGDDLSGLYKSQYKDKNGEKMYLAASQLQPVDARKVFPCFDEPDLKANFTVTIESKEGYDVLANMPLKRSRNGDQGWVTHYFETTPIMSTYLLAFVVAKFRHDDFITINGGFRISVWAQPDMLGQTHYAKSFIPKLYTYFNDYFDITEVVPKADHVAIPDFSAGAMENWGLVLYRERALLHDDQLSSEANKYWVSLLMAHEISHSWFGNMVTMKWWDDLWLNEGFANTLMYFALDNINSHWNVFDLQLVDNIYPVMIKDSLLTSHAISTPIDDPDDIPRFFDSISYDKGMAVLRLLRGFMGWNTFQTGLKQYVKTYKFGNAEMSQLWAIFNEAANYQLNVTRVMNTWTTQMGHPVVTVTLLKQNKQGEQVYLLTQERFLLNPEDEDKQDASPYSYQWEIPFKYQIQSIDVVQTKWIRYTDKQTTITVPTGHWILGNVGYDGFFRTNYDDQNWRRIINQLHANPKVFSAANRAGLISDAFNLARAGKLSYETPLNLSMYLDKEDEYVPWRTFIDCVDFMDGMLSTSESYGLLKKYVRDLVAQKYRLLGTSDSGELLERKLRSLIVETAARFGVPPAVDWALSNFQAWVDYGTRIPPDYASVIYSTGVGKGGEKEWNYMWEKALESRIASESGIMKSSLGATQQPWLLWRYAGWALDGEKVRMQDVHSHFDHYKQTPLGRSVALSFLLTSWNKINDNFGGDVYLIRDVIYSITSLVNTEFEFRMLQQLYRDRPPAGVAKKAAEDSLALIRSNINWMNTNYNTIAQWLQKNIPPSED